MGCFPLSDDFVGVCGAKATLEGVVSLLCLSNRSISKDIFTVSDEEFLGMLDVSVVRELLLCVVTMA